MAEFRYPLDLSGTNPSNKVTQTRTLNMTTKNGDKFFIPSDAPFYGESVIITRASSNTPLVRGVDYELIFDYPDLFETTQKYIFGGVKFKDRNISGQVTIQMQVMGGPFLQPVQNTLESIARNRTNVNTATWGELAGVPAGFPVLNHVMESDDMVGFGDLNTTIKEFTALILEYLGGGTGGGGSNAAIALIQAHIANPTNAHSKSAVGLGNVPNYAVSTFAEADLGVNNKLVTPAISKYLISRYSGISDILAIQQQIIQINRSIVDLSTSQNTVNINVSNLTQQVNQLNQNFEMVKQEFNNLKTYVQDLSGNIQTITDLVNTLREQVNSALQTISSMQTTVNRISQENVEINTTLGQLKTNLDKLNLSVSDLTNKVNDLDDDLNKVKGYVLYPIRRFIPAGTYHFNIAPGEKRTITLYGPGGGGGVMIPVGRNNVTDIRGENATDTVLYLNTDLTNGMNNVGKVILKAGGGRGGYSTTQSATGIEVYGKGGAGGVTSSDNFVIIIANGLGQAGIDGSSAPTGSHPGGTGNTVQGIVFGNGGASNQACGSGGAGAFIRAEIKNDKTFDLMFTIQVGVAGKNAAENNLVAAGSGLAIIELS